jgi:hypothetical protein
MFYLIIASQFVSTIMTIIVVVIASTIVIMIVKIILITTILIITTITIFNNNTHPYHPAPYCTTPYRRANMLVPGFGRFKHTFKASVEEFFSPKLLPVLSFSFLLVALSLAVTGML